MTLSCFLITILEIIALKITDVSSQSDSHTCDFIYSICGKKMPSEAPGTSHLDVDKQQQPLISVALPVVTMQGSIFHFHDGSERGK